MARLKSDNVQINISIPSEWKKELENLARIYSVEEGETITFLDLMLMCGKVTHKNLIDSSPLFRYCLTHASCNFFVKTIDSDTSKEI